MICDAHHGTNVLFSAKATNVVTFHFSCCCWSCEAECVRCSFACANFSSSIPRYHMNHVTWSSIIHRHQSTRSRLPAFNLFSDLLSWLEHSHHDAVGASQFRLPITFCIFNCQHGEIVLATAAANGRPTQLNWLASIVFGCGTSELHTSMPTNERMIVLCAQYIAIDCIESICHNDLDNCLDKFPFIWWFCMNDKWAKARHHLLAVNAKSVRITKCDHRHIIR